MRHHSATAVDTDRAFTLIDLPPVSPAFLDAYAALPVVESSGGLVRRRVSLRFQLVWTADDHWFVAPYDTDLPALSDLTTVLGHALSSLWLDLSTDWAVELQQIRTTVSQSTPLLFRPYDGSGREGHEGQGREHPDFLMVAALRREGVMGGETLLFHPGHRRTPAWSGIIRPGQALLADLRRTAHCLTEPSPAQPGGTGSQDLLIGTLSRRDVPRPRSSGQSMIISPSAAIAAKPA